MPIRIEPVSEEIQQVVIEDTEDGQVKATVTFKRGNRVAATVLEFEHGIQGTWARLLLDDGRQLCITQSATMEPTSYYILDENVVIPDEPSVVME